MVTWRGEFVSQDWGSVALRRSCWWGTSPPPTMADLLALGVSRAGTTRSYSGTGSGGEFNEGRPYT